MQSQDVEDAEGDTCLPPEGVPFQTSFQPSCVPSTIDSSSVHVTLRFNEVSTLDDRVHQAKLDGVDGFETFCGQDTFCEPLFSAAEH